MPIFRGRVWLARFILSARIAWETARSWSVRFGRASRPSRESSAVYCFFEIRSQVEWWPGFPLSP